MVKIKILREKISLIFRKIESFRVKENVVELWIFLADDEPEPFSFSATHSVLFSVFTVYL